MEHIEVILFVLPVAVAGLVILAGYLKVPYPVMLVVGGLALGLVPGLPRSYSGPSSRPPIRWPPPPSSEGSASRGGS